MFGQVRSRLSDPVLSFFLLALTRPVLPINLLQGGALEFRMNPDTVLPPSGLAECSGSADGSILCRDKNVHLEKSQAGCEASAC